MRKIYLLRPNQRDTSLCWNIAVRLFTPQRNWLQQRRADGQWSVRTRIIWHCISSSLPFLWFLLIHEFFDWELDMLKHFVDDHFWYDSHQEWRVSALSHSQAHLNLLLGRYFHPRDDSLLRKFLRLLTKLLKDHYMYNPSLGGKPAAPYRMQQCNLEHTTR